MYLKAGLSLAIPYTACLALEKSYKWMWNKEPSLEARCATLVAAILLTAYYTNPALALAGTAITAYLTGTLQPVVSAVQRIAICWFSSNHETLTKYGEEYQKEKNYSQAFQCYDRALSLINKDVRALPAAPASLLFKEVSLLVNMGDCELGMEADVQKGCKTALPTYQHALQRSQKIVQNPCPASYGIGLQQALILTQLAKCYDGQGHHDASIESLLKALALFQLEPSSPSHTVSCYIKLSRSYRLKKDYQRALDSCTTGLAIATAHWPTEHAFVRQLKAQETTIRKRLASTSEA